MAKNVARADIQALRAVAVMLVVLYHFWPQRLTGGYVGVDVFFVISGFLITTHLLAAPPGGPGDLAAFWGRRIRRLLPAAFLVLVVSLAATWLLAPETLWRDTARQEISSAFYVQNWVLAQDAVNYLAQDNVPTAVQHYWSLSIEEQFYVGWPILILLATWLARRIHVDRRITSGVAILAVLVASLAWSVIVTPHDPAAYFLSQTRFWELAVGGLAAIVAPLIQTAGLATLRALAAWAGLAAVAYSAFTFDGATVFPGAAALVPVLGTAVVILADVRPAALSPLWLMRRGSVRVLGDASYSIYLWHWPFVILLPYALGEPARWPVKVIALAVVIALSVLTKNFVEERFRGRRPLGQPLRRSFVFAAAGALVVTAFAGGLVLRTNAITKVDLAGASTDPCFAVGALRNAGCDPHGDRMVMGPLAAKKDLPVAYADNCILQGNQTDWKTCDYGSDDPDAKQIALVGNSHAAQWLPALIDIANRENWHIKTYMMFSCYTVDRPIDFRDPKITDNCYQWNKSTIDAIARSDVDLTIVSNSVVYPLVGTSTEAQSLELAKESATRVLERWRDAGQRVLIIRDPPAPPTDNTPDCVASHPDDLGACDGSVKDAKSPDPMAAAAKELGLPRIKVLDLKSSFCKDGTCFATIGGLVAYYDRSHVTATYVRSLTPEVEDAVDGMLRKG